MKLFSLILLSATVLATTLQAQASSFDSCIRKEEIKIGRFVSAAKLSVQQMSEEGAISEPAALAQYNALDQTAELYRSIAEATCQSRK
ncbi:MAG: hypothetical protein EOP06_03445 [Proteobacteria bacterium]|nr:MAG: hypothetical protein EOP06_03445 [Pseudomonadota bacterium]